MLSDSLLIITLNFLITIGPRVPGTPAHEKLREFLISNFKKMGYESVVDSFKKDGVSFYNLIFKKGKGDYILIGTHYDTRPGIEGANDSGSGVILLLYLASILRTFDKNFMFVFFDGEDFGEIAPLYGSRHFVKVNRENIKYAFVFDMIGDRELEIYKEGYSSKYAKEITDRVFNFAERKEFDFLKNQIKYYIIDDHFPLLEKGIKACLFIDFDYPYWHTDQDTWDKISLDSIKKVAKFFIDFLREENP